MSAAALTIANTEAEPRTDLELIEAANHGDSAAFEALYYRHRDWVVNLAFRFVADRDQALDILQETFLYFAKKFPGFALTCQLRSFLYPVVKNLSLNALSKSRRFQPGDELFLQLEAPSSPAQDDSLCAALAKIPAIHREVLILRFVDGMSLSEIAEALEAPLGTIKSRLHNALSALRQDPSIRAYFE